jgi:hypothetical protein
MNHAAKGPTARAAPVPVTALMDNSTAYGATEFVEQERPREPWAKKCFQSFVDVAVNHGAVHHPRATRRGLAADAEEGLASILVPAREIGLVSLYSLLTAEDIEVSESHMEEIFRDFILFARENRNALAQWLSLHLSPTLRGRHEASMQDPRLTQQRTLDFWQGRRACTSFADELRIRSEDLMIAFDAFQRGLLYYIMASESGSCYFYHPYRSALFARHFDTVRTLTQRWSWGSYLATLLEANQLPRELQYMVQLMGTIRAKTLSYDATVYSVAMEPQSHSNAYRDKIIAIASEIGLPARVTDRTKALMAILASSAGAAIDGIFGTLCMATLALGLATFSLTKKELYVRGEITQLRVLRGCLTWPSLFGKERD